jgi:microcin C transport system substrate-binding protein
MWHSSFADQTDNNNVTGFKNARVDELCAAYDKMFDLQQRIEAIREIDGILTSSYHYVLHWTAPFIRVAYWNRFGTPPGHLSRTGDYYTAHLMRWFDAEKDAKLRNAMRDSSIKLDVGDTEERHWLGHDKKQSSKL